MDSKKVIMQKLGSLSLILIVLFCPNGDAGNVDCRKFVFAPICRGVAAKRAVQQDIISSLLHDENSRALLNRRSRMNEINEEESFPGNLRLDDLTNKAEGDIFDEQSEEKDPEQEQEKAAIKDSLIKGLRRYWDKVKAATRKTEDKQKSVSRILDTISGRTYTLNRTSSPNMVLRHLKRLQSLSMRRFHSPRHPESNQTVPQTLAASHGDGLDAWKTILETVVS